MLEPALTVYTVALYLGGGRNIPSKFKAALVYIVDSRTACLKARSYRTKYADVCPINILNNLNNSST